MDLIDRATTGDVEWAIPRRSAASSIEDLKDVDGCDRRCLTAARGPVAKCSDPRMTGSYPSFQPRRERRQALRIICSCPLARSLVPRWGKCAGHHEPLR